MSKLTFLGNPINTNGNPLSVGSKVPNFNLTSGELKEITLADYKGKKKVLNIFPSIDTSVCAKSVRDFNVKAAALPNTVVLNISQDLPFAQSRFCGAEGIKNSITLSAFRSTFGEDYGVLILDGPLKGLTSRLVIVVDENDTVKYCQQVSEVTEAVDIETALKAI